MSLEKPKENKPTKETEMIPKEEIWPIIVDEDSELLLDMVFSKICHIFIMQRK